MEITINLDEEAAAALAAVIRQLRPSDYEIDEGAWYRALDELSPGLPKRSDVVGKQSLDRHSRSA